MMIAVVIIALRIWRSEHAAIVTAVVVATLAVVLAGLFVYFRMTRIVVTVSHVVRTDILRRRRSIPRGEIERVVMVRNYISGGSKQDFAAVLNRGGHRILKLDGHLWSEASIQQVADALNVPVEERDAGKEGIKELRKEYPWIVSWVEAHPILLAVLITVLLIAGIVVFLLATRGF